ncbi:hypothetical protein SCMU_19350 [Sinomonas cyclohexanicum]|uniref:Helix-turn-helix domain-containing protein n=1 Tax=Sinomonas cyclohexanicum TaxID=322009 RepID=A0ABN6FH66_SINCY|nr:helix-turn-helix domain-containing protein [Corynebacterium cyclohexanicum]BCT76093.1 hypothetical protein SCMU_19350 [Corynebacterium cyclohexanicum]
MPTTPVTCRLVTTDDLAVVLAVSTRTIRRLRAAGVIRPVPGFSRALRWDVDAVVAALNAANGRTAGGAE